MPGWVFDLPVGGIVEIAGVQYRHLGGGACTSVAPGARPYLIEGLQPHLEFEPVHLRPCEPGLEHRWRGLHACVTPEERDRGGGR